MRLLLLSTPVGPLGSGLGGGVETTVLNLAQVLSERGHRVAIATPTATTLLETLPKDKLGDDISLIQISGTWQPTAQTQDRGLPAVTESALANMWGYARRKQDEYDLLVNFAYDWLPFYLTPFLSIPVAHFVSMGSLSNCLDSAINQVSTQFPGTLGAYSRTQVATFQNMGLAAWEILGCGLDMKLYEYCGGGAFPQGNRPKDYLAWVGRISPEKGLEDAISAACLAKKTLKIFGKLEDADYWQHLQPLVNRVQQTVSIDYCGFLSTADLQQALGRAQALLMTPKWTEAFGIVAVEALACGVPVIAYERGGPAEIVRSGKTGWLVEPDDTEALANAVSQISQINRRECRQQAVSEYSLSAWGQRFEQWFCRIVAEKTRRP